MLIKRIIMIKIFFIVLHPSIYFTTARMSPIHFHEGALLDFEIAVTDIASILVVGILYLDILLSAKKIIRVL